MKKLLVLLMAFALLLCACASGGGEPTKPEEISVGNQVLSYEDSSEEFERCGFASGKKMFDIGAEGNGVLVGDDGNVRYIRTEDSSVLTYKGIKVGDSIEKVKESFEVVTGLGTPMVTVILDSETGKALDTLKIPMSQAKDDWIYITYYLDEPDGTIEKITIFDRQLAMYGK
ncbi:MAG: hypothetical protein IJA08_03610 [Clostridia bacterium]|nr:hypothetical protein [Clostridia bacterium]